MCVYMWLIACEGGGRSECQVQGMQGMQDGQHSMQGCHHSMQIQHSMQYGQHSRIVLMNLGAVSKTTRA